MDTKDLIARLRNKKPLGTHAGIILDCHNAADALEAQAQEIKALESDVSNYQKITADLETELERMKATTPVDRNAIIEECAEVCKALLASIPEDWLTARAEVRGAAVAIRALKDSTPSPAEACPKNYGHPHDYSLREDGKCWMCGHDADADLASSAFPERDESKTAEQQGLYRKFEVRRVDGSDRPGGKHHGCAYFVLDMVHDQHAPAALRAYAESCKTTHPELAADLERRFGQAPSAEPVGYFCRDAVGLLHQVNPSAVAAFPNDPGRIELFAAPPAPAPADCTEPNRAA